jgi:hypothetical protein
VGGYCRQVGWGVLQYPWGGEGGESCPSPPSDKGGGGVRTREQLEDQRTDMYQMMGLKSYLADGKKDSTKTKILPPLLVFLLRVL